MKRIAKDICKTKNKIHMVEKLQDCMYLEEFKNLFLYCVVFQK